MDTLILIDNYRNIIQEYVSSQKTPPHSNDILLHLLKNYIGSDSTLQNTLYIFTRTHIGYAQKLSKELNDPKFSDQDLLNSLNTHLTKMKLDKNGDFFALLVAYFYYYKDKFIE